VPPRRCADGAELKIHDLMSRASHLSSAGDRANLVSQKVTKHTPRREVRAGKIAILGEVDVPWRNNRFPKFQGRGRCGGDAARVRPLLGVCVFWLNLP